MAEVDLSESNGGALVVTSITLLVVTWLSVVLRCYVRAFMTKGFQIDDWLMVVAQASFPLRQYDDHGHSVLIDAPSQIVFTLSCSLILLGVNTGLGHHNKALGERREVSALMVCYFDPHSFNPVCQRRHTVSGLGYGHICPRHALHQAEHRLFPTATLQLEAL